MTCMPTSLVTSAPKKLTTFFFIFTFFCLQMPVIGKERWGERVRWGERRVDEGAMERREGGIGRRER